MIFQTWFKRFAAVTLLAVIGSILLAQGVVKASPQDTAWGATEVRSKNGSQAAVYSSIDYDTAGKIHIAWFEYGPTDGDLSRVLYTNNVNGAWSTPFEVSNSAARGAEPLLSIVAESNATGNRVHFLYVSSSNQVVHRYLTLGAGLPLKSPVTVMSNNKGANPNLTLDTLGRVNALWITRAGDSAPYLVSHRMWIPNATNGAWEGGSRVVRPDGVLQKFPKGAVTNDGRLHAVFLSNGRFRYSIFNGSQWAPSTDISPGGPKQIGLTTDGATLFVLYSAQPGNTHNVYLVQGSNGAWSAPALLSSGSSYDEMPDPFFSPGNNTVYALWASGSSPQTTRTVVREYNLGIGFGSVVNFGGETTQYPHGSASPNQISVIWQDKINNIYDIRHKIANLNVVPPTPTPTNTPVPSVDFTLNVITGPGNSVQINVNPVTGTPAPNQVRYSTTPFVAETPPPLSGDGAWEPIPAGSIPYAVNPTANCMVTVYVQVRNGTTLTASAVKTGTTSVDTSIQAAAIIRTRMEAGTLRSLAPNTAQPNAPEPPNTNYSRDDQFFYDITQEPTGCSQITKHKAGQFESSQSYPYSGQADFYPFNNGADSTGVGLIEQTVVATVRLTDTIGNTQNFVRTINIDDDPPVLAAGGLISFTDGLTSTSVLVDIDFTATVTDDGFIEPGAPAGKKYWGLWVVATNSTSLPTPATFEQFGRLVPLQPGATSATVQVTNPGLSTSGPRYVHVRFLDGAGNYTEAGITSPQLILADGFRGLLDHHPLILR